MTVTIARVAAVLALILGIALGIQTWWLNRAASREFAARVAVQDATLKAAGWEKAATASQAELAATVPALQAQLGAAKKAKATTAIASHWQGSGEEIAIPCTVVMGPPAGTSTPTSGAPDPTRSPGAPPSVAVTPHVKIDDAVALDDAGGIFVARTVQAQLTVGSSWASAWEDIVPDAGSTTKVAPEIEAAWKAYKNPPPRIAILPRSIKQWRVGWFVGPALTVGIDGKVGVGAAVGWGIAF